MPQLEINPDKKFFFFLGVVTLAGFFLRLHGLASESITGDEASSLLQAKFPTFKAMIDGGVRTDVHPAFTESFLWFWTKLFGWSEFAARLPFAIFGTASIWLSGVIGRKWFSNTAGLSVAIGMAFLQFPLIYSQLIRPYAPGLFFTLLAAYFWTQFVNEKSKCKRDIAGFAFATALAAYSHYFSLLATTLLALSGLFFVVKEIRLRYLLACTLAVLLFLPHLSITLGQMKMGGVGGPNGWLPKPTPAFLQDHLKFGFDNSRGLMCGVFLLSILSFIFFFKRPNKFQLMAFSIWILPLLIGYIYSVEKNPILENSGLLFVFPFFLMLLFSTFPDYNLKKMAFLFPAGLALVFFGYVTIYKPYHLTDHFGRLKELVTNTIDWQKKYANEKVDVFYNVDAPFYVNYNYEQLGKPQKNILGTINNGKDELLAFRKLVENSDADYFVYGWSTKYSPLEIFPIIEERFPYLIEEHEWFNSAVYLFAKTSTSCGIVDKDLFSDSLAIDDHGEMKSSDWKNPCKIISVPEPIVQPEDSKAQNLSFFSLQIITHYHALQLDSSCIYSPLLKKNVGDILKNPDNTILFSTNVKLLNKNSDVILVIKFERDGKQLYWNGIESTTQIDTTKINDWQNVYFGIQLPGDLKRSDTVSFYCYSKNGLPLLIDYLDVKTLKDHPGIYGPRPDYK